MDQILDFFSNIFKLFGAATILLFFWRKIIYRDSRIMVLLKQNRSGIQVNIKNLHDKPLYITKISVKCDKVLYSRTAYGFQNIGKHDFEVDKPFYKNIEHILNEEKNVYLYPSEEFNFFFDEMVLAKNESDFKNSTLKKLISDTIYSDGLLSLNIVIKAKDSNMREFVNKIPWINKFNYHFDINLNNLTSTFENLITNEIDGKEFV